MVGKVMAVQSRLPLRLEPDEEIVSGVRFGRSDELLSPAYWQMRCQTASSAESDFVNRHGSLEEEIGFCLLGGYGVTLEVANAFYVRLRDEGVFQTATPVEEHQILALLMVPAEVKGRPHRYRFPKQRARRLHAAMWQLREMELNTAEPLTFRDQIQSLEGVGPKTASWIARNWLDVDEIAILDIHVLRAGWAINLFQKNCRLPKDYLALEHRFLIFAKELHVRTSVLDAVMWTDMRKFGSNLVRDVVLA